MYNQRFILQLYNLDVSQIQWVYTWKHLYGERIDKKGCISSWATELSCLLHVNVETLCTLFGLIFFFIISLTLFFIYKQYNINIHVKHGEDPSTHPEYDLELWFEVGATSGFDKNWVYGFFMTMTFDMRSDCSVLNIDL